MRTLPELTDVPDPAWPLLLRECAGSPAAPEVLTGDPAQGAACLLQLQVTARSYLGAMALNCGGLRFGGGWLRVYGGAGGAGLPGLAEVNGFPTEVDPAWRPDDALVLGHDVLGGVFALNGPDPAALGRPGAPGQVRYLAPDTLEWEALEMGHGAWLGWLLSGAVDSFYQGLRWPGWQQETAALSPDQGITVYPFLWSKEARADLAGTTRRPARMAELLGITAEFCAQFGLPDPGFLGRV
ncbi:DUF2625 family protein [Kitasatospora paranensis]|uniref:DUF2625 family protein n=1 Tax=Kitasatospora paranensis TaxID=258053 RepID=A0ABW2G1P3_9ACTN